MGREAISSARVAEACSSVEKVLVSVVLVCGASVARALLRLGLVTELVLMTNPLKYETGPFSVKIGPARV
jgi:dihydrofolate reductase